MKRLVVAITTRIQDKTHYVKSETVLANSELSVELTTREDEIKEYSTHADAFQKIPKIRDPFGRQYSVTTVPVWHKKSSPNLQADLR